MLIDKTYFIGEINVAGANVPGSAVLESLALFINKREPEYLELSLGYSFNELFQAGIADIDGRWFDLRTGTTYVDHKGITRNWKGLQQSGQLSPIANYIYYWYMSDAVTLTTTLGEMQTTSENAKVAASGFKMAKAWNEMAEQTKTMHDFLLNKVDDTGIIVYPEFSHREVRHNDVIKYIGALL